MAQKPCSVIRLSLICPCFVHHCDYRRQLSYPQSPSCSCLIIDIYCLIGWIWTGINTHLDDGEPQWVLSDTLLHDITKRKGSFLLHIQREGGVFLELEGFKRNSFCLPEGGRNPFFR